MDSPFSSSGPSPLSEAQREDVDQNRDLAAFSYILIFSPLLFFTHRESAFLRFHVKQALCLTLFFTLFAFLPGWLSYMNLFVAAGALMGFLEAQAGHFYRLPLIANLVEGKFSFTQVKDTLFHLTQKLRKAPPQQTTPESLVPEEKETTLTAEEVSRNG